MEPQIPTRVSLPSSIPVITSYASRAHCWSFLSFLSRDLRKTRAADLSLPTGPSPSSRISIVPVLSRQTGKTPFCHGAAFRDFLGLGSNFGVIPNQNDHFDHRPYLPSSCLVSPYSTPVSDLRMGLHNERNTPMGQTVRRGSKFSVKTCPKTRTTTFEQTSRRGPQRITMAAQKKSL